MAQKGALYLKSASLLDMYNAINTFETTVQDALYAQYKEAYKISLTNYMRGDAADAFKNYFTQGTINMITGLMDVSSEMTMIIQLITEAFYQFESADDGAVKEGRLDEIGTNLSGYQDTYNAMESELATVMSLASEHINVTNIEFDTVNDSYSDVETQIQAIRDDMYAVDDEVLKSVEELLTRITDLKTLVTNTMGLCYKDGNFMPENIGDLSSKDWYSKQSNATLTLMLAEDPFAYDAGAVSVSEDQWAKGLCSDIYAYAGYSFLSASYEAGKENGSVFINARANVFNGNAYAQLTDYVKAQAELNFVYGSVDAKAGAGDGYFGAHVEAEAGVIKVDGEIVVGIEEFNGYVKGDAKVLCADGKAAFEFEENGQYAVGVSGSATLASASAKAGIKLLSYEVNDGSATSQKKDDLIKLNVGVGADAGAAFTAFSESKTAIETKYVNINATSIEIEIGLGVDLEVDITIPTVYVKWPW